jgi:ribosomal protein L11 methyltransferase
MRNKNWHIIELETDRNCSEAVESAFNELDALGTAISSPAHSRDPKIVVRGYFETLPSVRAVSEAIQEAIRIAGCSSEAIGQLKFDTIEDRDWLEEWKKSWKPTKCGRFVIAPPWNTEKFSNDSIIINIEPGMAFGTGTHETTRLCLSAIEKYLYPEWKVLDVGTGTGILAIASAKLLGGRGKDVIGIDNDIDAVRIAAENASLNSETQISFIACTIDAIKTSYDLIVANLTLDAILPILPQLIAKTKHVLILSGILSSQKAEISAALKDVGIYDFEIFQDGEWISVITRLTKV